MRFFSAQTLTTSPTPIGALLNLLFWAALVLCASMAPVCTAAHDADAFSAAQTALNMLAELSDQLPSTVREASEADPLVSALRRQPGPYSADEIDEGVPWVQVRRVVAQCRLTIKLNGTMDANFGSRKTANIARGALGIPLLVSHIESYMPFMTGKAGKDSLSILELRVNKLAEMVGSLCAAAQSPELMSQHHWRAHPQAALEAARRWRGR